ncbi:hypothetical protein HanIR_Chr09g0401441 [Helianthus annuus]|nr:hypothetical protein HanIR_Chr09g0401441 [Helianthus annuus]
MSRRSLPYSSLPRSASQRGCRGALPRKAIDSCCALISTDAIYVSNQVGTEGFKNSKPYYSLIKKTTKHLKLSFRI